MRKLTALLAGGIGYVLGARAGRQRYEQLRQAATRVTSNPKVQQTAQQAKEAAPVIKEKVSGAATAVTSKVGGSGSGSQSSTGTSSTGTSSTGTSSTGTSTTGTSTTSTPLTSTETTAASTATTPTVTPTATPSSPSGAPLSPPPA